MKKYLKGALHVHTNLSDGMLSPQEVVAKYKAKGYDFIVFTDHKINFDIPKYITDDMGMVLIGGVELDVGIEKDVDYREISNEALRETLMLSRMRNEFDDLAWPHVNALGVYDTNMKFDIIDGNVPKTYENMIDVINENGGLPMINHPNWWFCSSLRELLEVNREYLLEIGGNPESSYCGNCNKESLETIWDILNTKGKRTFGTFTDDSHEFKDGSDRIDYNVGYVCVWAERDEKSILKALWNGDFYSSNGIDLEEYDVTDKGIKIKVKPDLEWNNDNGAKIEPRGGVKYAIMFKGKMGMPLKTVYGTEAEYEFTGGEWEDYVRVKVVSNKAKHSHWQEEWWKYYEVLLTQPCFRK